MRKRKLLLLTAFMAAIFVSSYKQAYAGITAVVQRDNLPAFTTAAVTSLKNDNVGDPFQQHYTATTCWVSQGVSDFLAVQWTIENELGELIGGQLSTEASDCNDNCEFFAQPGDRIQVIFTWHSSAGVNSTFSQWYITP